MPGQTPLYGFPFPLRGEPIAAWRAIWQGCVQTWENALAAKGIPAPGATDLLALAARVGILEADTGWQNLSLNTGVTPLGTGGVAQWRKIGKRIFLRGAVTGTLTPGLVVATLPTTSAAGAVWPTAFVREDCATNDATTTIRRLNVDNANGQVVVNGSGTGNVTWQSLDGVSWVP